MVKSNAFSRSQKMPPTMILLFKASRISLASLYTSFFVDLVIKPKCTAVKILFLLMCSQSLIYIALSSTVENEITSDIGL
jgi:hypothetical protein